MKTATVFAIISGLLPLVSAQVYPEITWQDVSNNTRQIWCEQQIGICPNLCQDQGHVDPTYNDCFWEDLYFDCICEGGFRPNMTEYSLTIPYNLCIESKQQCANKCGNDQDCVSKCFSGKSCGASDPRRVPVTSTSTTASQTTTGTSTNKPTDGSETTKATTTPTEDNPFDNSGSTIPFTAFGSAYGVGAMIAGMAVGFFGML